MKKTTVIFALCGVLLFPLVVHAGLACYSGGGVLWRLKLAFACTGTGSETVTPVVGRVVLITGDQVTFTGTCESKAGLVKIGGSAPNTATSLPFVMQVAGTTPAGPLTGGYSNAPTFTFNAMTFTKVACSTVPPPSQPTLPEAPDAAAPTPGAIR